MADPATHGGVPVQRIDTHGAVVFLAGAVALKIKRAVKYPYLDYSTLARRKDACEQELQVNCAFAPQIYRGLRSVRQSPDGSLSIDGDGELVEWALEMNRFDERKTVNHLAEQDALPRTLLREIAEAIAASHHSAALAACGPWIDSMTRIIAGNSTALIAGGFDGATIAALDDASRAAFARCRPLLEQRGAERQVRRCHGDLHLENIVVIDGHPVLFDAIEFDPVIASTDVLYDLAFALMDFLHYRRGAAASIVFNRYLESTGDTHLEALSLLPLLLSMRAAIRANVLLARPVRDDDQRRAIRRESEAYLDLACRLIAPAAPRLIAIGGLSGTGKSALARALAPDLGPLPGAVVLRADVARKQHFQVADTVRLSADAYRPEVSMAIYAGLAQRAACVLAQGHAVIVDAVFARAEERTAIAAVAAAAGVPFHGLFLTTDLATRIARIEHRVGDASDATADVARNQQQYQLGPLDWTLIDASGAPEATQQRARAAISAGG
jgi:aminoglycoside phosphotransferase family enzyme/predicted kinase